MIVSFPWYDLPPVQWANDALYKATGLDGELNRELSPTDTWYSPDLLISQACGLDLFFTEAPIQPFAAPIFDLDCEPGHYYSYIVGDPDGQVAAINSLSSRSGLSALFTVCQPIQTHITGSHLASLAALRAGTVDVAAIDAVTWHILERSAPEHIDSVRIVDRSTTAPAPPFVSRRDQPHSIAMAVLDNAFDHSTSAKKALGITGVNPVTYDDYLPVLHEYQHIVAKLPANCRSADLVQRF
ncbi:MAG: PhnD/SsuA/transferrin family substrate-binding protein [Pseudomonadota bacterium]